MIAKLKGLLETSESDHLILDVQGVGYKVQCSSRTLSRLPEIGEACVLHIETIVREDAFNLYGFLEQEEQLWFRTLLTVQGVGSRVALAILTACDANTLQMAISSQDKVPLTHSISDNLTQINKINVDQQTGEKTINRIK